MPRSNGSRVAPLNPLGTEKGCPRHPDAGPSFRVTTLPPATRDAQLDHWSVARERTGDRSTRNLRARKAHPEETPLRRIRHGRRSGVAVDLFRLGGFGIRSGSAHRGILAPDEVADEGVLLVMVEERLGFTLAEIESVYRQGPLSAQARALRDRIDARFLEIAEGGGLMIELAKALGWSVKPNGACRKLENALARARATREAA